jgi:hypothetical protein
MKRILHRTYPLWGTAGLILALSAGNSLATQTLLISSFDTSGTTSGWYFQNWNGSTATIGWGAGPANDADGNAASGSLQCNTDFGNPSYQGGAYRSPGMSQDISAYTAIEYDIKVDPASPLDAFGNVADVKVGFSDSGWGLHNKDLNIAPVSTNGGWQHVVIPLSSIGGIGPQPIKEVVVQVFDNNYATTNTTTFFVDNIKFTGPDPAYPNYTAFTFDNGDFLHGVVTNWYGNPVYLEWSTQDASNNASSGSMHVIADFTKNNNCDVVALPFDTNYDTTFGSPETNIVIDGTHYSAVELDVKWDTTLSTVDLTNFNARGDISGFPLGLLYNVPIGGPYTGNGGQVEAAGSAAPAIPNEASNGWVHMVIPLNRSTAGIDQTVGVWLKKYTGGPPDTGTVAYYVDNIVFDGAPLAVPQPTISISKPVVGVNCLATGAAANAPYDRESLATFDFNYSWVDQASPVTYSMGIADFPDPAKYPNYVARIMLIPNSAATEAEADWTESTAMLIDIQSSGGGVTTTTLRCKTNSPNGNGTFFDASNPVFTTTNSPVTGNWAFTFTQNTNIHVVAPDGESTNLPFPLGFSSSDVSAWFPSSQLVVYFGSINNGGGNIGQRLVMASAGITNGSTTMLWDKFTSDTNIDENTSGLPGGGKWIIASDASTVGTGVFLIATNTSFRYYIDWTTPANGFVLQTNSVLSDSAGWASTGLPAAAQLGDHYHIVLSDTNLPPPGGDLYFRSAKVP